MKMRIKDFFIKIFRFLVREMEKSIFYFIVFEKM